MGRIGGAGGNAVRIGQRVRIYPDGYTNPLLVGAWGFFVQTDTLWQGRRCVRLEKDSSHVWVLESEIADTPARLMKFAAQYGGKDALC